jgi:prevent-host-death family protein
MAEVTIRDLRDKGGEVIDRVVDGEVLTVMRNGRPVARLSPIPEQDLPIDVIRERWRDLPPMNHDTLRRELDDVIDPSL